MALDATVLAQLMKTKVDAQMAEAADVDAVRDGFFLGLAEAFVEHVTQAGTVTVTVTSVSGVTPGPGTSGPGNGTGTIA